MCACDQSSIFSTSGKFCPDYRLLLELHAFTLIAHSYALLLVWSTLLLVSCSAIYTPWCLSMICISQGHSNIFEWVWCECIRNIASLHRLCDQHLGTSTCESQHEMNLPRLVWGSHTSRGRPPGSIEMYERIANETGGTVVSNNTQQH